MLAEARTMVTRPPQQTTPASRAPAKRSRARSDSESSDDQPTAVPSAARTTPIESNPLLGGWVVVASHDTDHGGQPAQYEPSDNEQDDSPRAAAIPARARALDPEDAAVSTVTVEPEGEPTASPAGESGTTAAPLADYSEAVLVVDDVVAARPAKRKRLVLRSDNE